MYLLQVSYVYKVAVFIIVCVEIYSEYKKCNREGVNLGKCTQFPCVLMSDDVSLVSNTCKAPACCTAWLNFLHVVYMLCIYITQPTNSVGTLNSVRLVQFGAHLGSQLSHAVSLFYI